MQNLRLLLGVMVGTLVLVFGMAYLFSRNEAPKIYDEALLLGRARHVRNGGAIEASGSALIASESAKADEVVTIVEFSDFQCPSCKDASPYVDRLRDQYGDKVRLVFRHFPLESIHKNAMGAARASEAAAADGKFWEYHDLLFKRQDDWKELENPEQVFLDYAEELGLDRDEFKARLDDDGLGKLLEGDMADGFSVGVTGTPTFFVDGEKTSDLAGALKARL